MTKEKSKIKDPNFILGICLLLSLIMGTALAYAKIQVKADDIDRNTEDIAELKESINSFDVEFEGVKTEIKGNQDIIKLIREDTLYLRGLTGN